MSEEHHVFTSKMKRAPAVLTLISLVITRCETEGYCTFPSFLWQPFQNGGTFHDVDGTANRKWFSRTEYTTNTQTWTRQKEIHAKRTEIVIYHRFHATCTGYEHSDRVPCFRQTRETRLVCVAEEPDGKYRVQQLTDGLEPTFTCLKFVRQTEFVIQLFSAVPNGINVDKLCYDVALQREEWPWIDVLNTPVLPCPINGGFDFRTHTGTRRNEKCPDEWRPARMESECMKGEGIHLTFPSSRCSFLYKNAIDQTLLCRGDWVEGNYHFILLSNAGGPPRYIMRLPAALDSGSPPPMFTYLYFSPVVPASGRGHPPGKVYHTELRMTRSDSDECYDESPKCSEYAREGRCNDFPIYEFANHCKRSCGLCDFMPYTKPECDFPPYYQGNWTVATTHGLETVSVTGGVLHVSVAMATAQGPEAVPGKVIQGPAMHSFVCRGKHWQLEYYKVHSVFSNGCRPRYNCVQLLPLGNDMLQMRLSNSSLEDQSFDICAFQNQDPPWKPVLLNSELKTLFNTARLHPEFCGLGGMFHTNVTFADGSSCEGILQDVDQVTCHVREELRVNLHACRDRDVHDHICVAFTQLPHGTSFLVTRSVNMKRHDAYQCWVIKHTESHRMEKVHTRSLLFNRAKCSTVEIISHSIDNHGILSMETFNDIVDSSCDGLSGSWERRFQGSTGLEAPVSVTPYSSHSDAWPHSKGQWSRDRKGDEESAAVKRTTTSGSVTDWNFRFNLWIISSFVVACHILNSARL